MSKMDVTDVLSFLDYYTVNGFNVKNHTSFFKKSVKTGTFDFIFLVSLFSSLGT